MSIENAIVKALKELNSNFIGSDTRMRQSYVLYRVKNWLSAAGDQMEGIVYPGDFVKEAKQSMESIFGPFAEDIHIQHKKYCLNDMSIQHIINIDITLPIEIFGDFNKEIGDLWHPEYDRVCVIVNIKGV